MTEAARLEPSTLIEKLPPVRGRLTANAPLAQTTWFQVGGPAEVLFKPADAEDLAAFLAACPPAIAVTVIGVASNLLIRDGGVPGVVVRLGRGFTDITADWNKLRAGAAALDLNVAMVAAQSGIAGLEFLVGVPGMIGGALRMNAGAYGGEMVDIVREATLVTRAGEIKTLKKEALGFGYRTSGVASDSIFIGCVLEGKPGAKSEIDEKMRAIAQARAETQPIRTKTGGSTFANPPGHKAWELIDKAGCRGLAIGGAQVSEKHTNFLINTGTATAADLEALGEEVRRRVLATSGIELQWEIKRIGVPTPGAGGAR
jgi:UDP-N-acetylmuramate dehydrogenase